MTTLEHEIEKLVEPVAERIVQRLLLEQRPPEPDQYLSVKKAALLLDVPEGTIRKWIQRGQIKRYKIQGCVRVKVSELVREED
jgi:excisionase family DNA binding protein